MDESRGSSDQEDEQIVQVREALMCPDGEKFEILRTARFLNYTTTSILDDDVFELPLDAFVSRPEGFDLEAKVSFSGWGSPSLNWIEWVNAMAELHEKVWKKSGVYEAILSSRYQIKRHDDLFMALIEKWCIETNTFVFPWGEATVTLEDMIVLGGFSVTGNNALAPVKRGGMKEVEEKMKAAKRGIEANLDKRCCGVSSWMKDMMNSGSDIEHEAFIVSWLSRFVFPSSGDVLREKLFPAAIQLAQGVRLGLAPAVLARIYRDLGVLKEHLNGCSERETMVVKSPFQFVQVWALERFMSLQPPGQPSQLKPGEPRIARWHHHGGGQDVYGYPEDIRAVLDSAKESFDYRPYTKPVVNFKFPKFYVEDDCWVRVKSDETVVAFGRCLRFAKLVGLDCIERYHPHRVALQFGYDQDVPGVVPARTETPELAWKDYIRPIADGMLYFPARLHEADVTVRYIRWWKPSVAVLQSEAKTISHMLWASHPKQKQVTTTAAVTTETKAISLSPGKWKTSAAKAEGKGQEVVKKRETETKIETSVTGSKIEVSRADGRSHDSSSYAGSLTGSEQATKHPLKKPEWVQRSSPKPKKSPDRSSDKPEWVQTSSARSTKSSDKPKSVQRSSPRSTKSPDRSSGRAADDVKDLKGALRGSGETRSQGHVTFQLPSSPGRSPSKAHTLSPKQNGSPVKKPRMLPRVADLAKGSSSSPRVPRHTSSVPLPPMRENYRTHHNSTSSRVSKESNTSPNFNGSPSKRKSPRSPEAVNSRGHTNPPSPRVSKGPYRSSPLSGSSSSTRMKQPRSPEAFSSRGNNNPTHLRVSKEKTTSPSDSGSPSSTRKNSSRPSENVNSCGNSSSGDNSVVKRNTDTSITVSNQESPRKNQLDISKANKLLEEMATVQEQVGEDGVVTYQIPKQQFENLSKGVHDVLHDLQSIKFALNIQDN